MEIKIKGWWCATYGGFMSYARPDQVPADGNPFPCCQSRIPHSNYHVEDRGCGWYQLKGKRIEKVAV